MPTSPAQGTEPQAPDVPSGAAELMQQLAHTQRAQSFLLRASEVLARAHGYTETIEQLAAVAVPTLGDLCLIDVYDEAHRLVRLAARHADPERQPLADELLRRYAPQVHGSHPSAEVLVSGVSRWSPEMPDEFLRETTIDARHYQIVKRLDFTSYMSVPLTADDRVLGVMTIVSAGSGRRFRLEDLSLAEDLARRVALVAAKARRYDVEHAVATELQSRLLPADLKSIPGLSIAVRYLAGTRDLHVGGDFFDTLAYDDHVTILVGDVAGHDVTAAATMGQLRSASRAFATQASGPAELLDVLQTNWERLGLDRMATGIAARIYPATGEVVIASAGHLPPILVSGETAITLPVEPGPPLGAPGAPTTEWCGEMPPGAVLLCYTDGLVEDRHQDIDVGLGDLLDTCRTTGERDAESFCDAVIKVMAGGERSDDVAVLAARRG